MIFPLMTKEKKKNGNEPNQMNRKVWPNGKIQSKTRVLSNEKGEKCENENNRKETKREVLIMLQNSV
jgi:hypothetical protein